MFAIVLSVLAVSADDKPAVPKQPPRILTASVKGDMLFTRRVVLAEVPVKTIKKVKQGDKEVEVAVTTYKVEKRPVTQAISLDGATFGTAGGKKLDLDAVKKRLARPTPIVISGDGKPVDESYLKLFDRDVIVIVMPPPALVVPDAPPTPKKDSK